MNRAYLTITSLLAVAEAVAATRALLFGPPGLDGMLWLEAFWLPVSVAAFVLTVNRGLWPGAAGGHVALASGAYLLLAATAGDSPLFWGFRAVGALGVLVLCVSTLRAIASGEADEGGPPRGVGAFLATTLLAATLAAVFTRRGLELAARPAPPPPSRILTAPTVPPTYRLHVAGRVMRPDGLTFPGVSVTLVAKNGTRRTGDFAASATVRTDRLGRFTFDGTAAESRVVYQLDFEVLGYKPKTLDGVTNEPRSAPIEVTLSPQG